MFNSVLSLSHVVSWVRCGTSLYRVLIFAAYVTLDIMRQSACLVVNHITVYSYNFLFNSTMLSQKVNEYDQEIPQDWMTILM